MSYTSLIAIRELLVKAGWPAEWATICWRVSQLVLILIIGAAAEMLLRRIVGRALKSLVGKTKTTWDDAVVRAGFLDRLTLFIPGVLVYRLLDVFFPPLSRALTLSRAAMHIVLIVFAVLALDSLLNAVTMIYSQSKRAKEVPIKGFVQVAKIVIYFIAGILIFSAVIGKSPVFLFSGLGALTAVLMLIFKDAILGFVAGIQLTSNKMVSIGDWLEMPKYGADGDVIDIALTTVKVQNWDKTITTIPTYALISDSFKNWRGMSESGGRRIKRSVNIDVNTIKFCDDDMLKRYAKIQYISEYLEKKKTDIAAYNQKLKADTTCRVNGRRLTNVGTFRAYVTAYLKAHPMVNQDMTFLVRQLQPTEHGLPIEIYVFCKDQVWANYEAIQADIFDHILAVIPEFDLRVFQIPSGVDLQALRTG
ncbi:MAG: mechanosensitive ion channel [Lentisphaeria bacterium]|nr:mechanosensitive ion channel [Lentisphaeria bacterium]